LPPAPRAHLEAARLVADAQAQQVRREVLHIRDALSPTGVDVILLKGAAYLCAGLSAARGRTFSDIDILVPAEALARVETALVRRGWMTTHPDAYDQRYYRRWMHELPPMRHVRRQTTLDVHHAIVPSTARLKPDSAKLIRASVPLGGHAGVRTLAPLDMVLHSAAHLFLNEEFGNGLRDLSDMHSLLREFATQPEFWPRLADRAVELELERPLYYALRYASRILHAPLPGDRADIAALGRPPAALRTLMDALFMRVLRPHHRGTADALTPIARQSLYVRAHWLRMPPLLLAMHLTVKAFRTPTHQR
jgi:hypothetical protein